MPDLTHGFQLHSCLVIAAWRMSRAQRQFKPCRGSTEVPGVSGVPVLSVYNKSVINPANRVMTDR